MVAKNTVEELLAEIKPAAKRLVDQAYEQLEEMIVLLQLKPGDVFSESELSEKLGIGRTPIREALQRLSREGMVNILPRRGILISEINPQNQILVLEVRRVLERLLARTAAIRRTEDEAKHFQMIADNLEKAAQKNDEIIFMRLDRVLHILLQQAAHNEYASRAMGLFNGLSRRFWYMHFREAGDMPLCARLHAELSRRIAEGDPDGSEAASDRLVDYTYELTYETLKTFVDKLNPSSR